jgi:hypothetical protein
MKGNTAVRDSLLLFGVVVFVVLACAT